MPICLSVKTYLSVHQSVYACMYLCIKYVPIYLFACLSGYLLLCVPGSTTHLTRSLLITFTAMFYFVKDGEELSVSPSPRRPPAPLRLLNIVLYEERRDSESSLLVHHLIFVQRHFSTTARVLAACTRLGVSSAASAALKVYSKLLCILVKRGGVVFFFLCVSSTMVCLAKQDEA